MHEEVLAQWMKDHLALQCPELRVSLEMWQGYQLALRNVQLNPHSIVDVDDLRNAIDVVEQSFSALPMGSILWHATHDTSWTYDHRLWLATSTSKKKAVNSVSYRAPSPPLLLKLEVASKKIMGLPCSADPFYTRKRSSSPGSSSYFAT